MAGMSVLEKKLGAKPSRVVFTYTIPDEYQGDVKTIGLVELTAEEELMATKRARNEGMRLAYELVKMSLREVNGQQVGVADGSSDAAWNNMPPKTRNLALQAFSDLHTPKDDAIESFLKGRQVRV